MLASRAGVKEAAVAELPRIIEELRDAINRGDLATFLSFFPEDGVVEDWGRRFTGHTAIKGWSDEELIGAKGTLTITGVLGSSPTWLSLETHWASNFFTGEGRFDFVIEGDKIRELRISEL
jgi:hypothetical protein